MEESTATTMSEMSESTSNKIQEILLGLKECSRTVSRYNKTLSKIAPKYDTRETKKILSWDCGLKSSSWVLLMVRLVAGRLLCVSDIDLLGCGTIDFLEGQKLKSVSRDLWPGLIKKGLLAHAPIIDTDTHVVIESQPQRFAGSICLGNTATQFCIAYHYSFARSINFINATQKNTFGPLSMKMVGKLTGCKDEALRKKHTRLNFELFMATRYQKKYTRGSHGGIKLRDVSDAFMQGLYFATRK